MEELAYVGGDEEVKTEVEEKLREVSPFDGIFAFRVIDTLYRGSAAGSATEPLLGTPKSRAVPGLRSSGISIKKPTPNLAVVPQLSNSCTRSR